MRIVQEQINAYSNDPTQAFEAHDLPSLRHGSPGLKFTVSVSPIWGSGGGTSWDDIPQPISYIEGKTRIATACNSMAKGMWTGFLPPTRQRRANGGPRNTAVAAIPVPSRNWDMASSLQQLTDQAADTLTNWA